MSREVYLDNAATTRPAEAAVDAALRAMQEGYHNPSALYAQGLAANKAMESCRALLKLSLRAQGLCFTSGGTEANNLGILGSLSGNRRQGKVLYSAIEHSAVKNACEQLSGRFEVRQIPVIPEGSVNLEALEALLDGDVALICVMQVNNEVGSVQPLEEIIRLRDRLCPDARLHVDGVQGFLRLPVDMRRGIDSYVLSAHKVHGLKGTGALAFSGRTKISPILFGGGQEGKLRAGTENTPGIAALEAAIRDFPAEDSVRGLAGRMVSLILDAIPDARVNSPLPESPLSSGHIVNLSFPPVRAQTLMHALEAEGVLVSQGSACSSRSTKPSPVLLAMGLEKPRAESALRFSLSHQTSQDDIEIAAAACAKAYRSLRPYTRR